MGYRRTVLMVSTFVLAIAEGAGGLAHVGSPPSDINLFEAFNCRLDDSRRARLLDHVQLPRRQMVQDRLALCARYEPILPRRTDPDDIDHVYVGPAGHPRRTAIR